MHFPESHTAENIAEKINSILEKWGLEDSDRQNAIVRDGAANMRSGCNMIPMTNFHCAIHLLQLSVDDGLLKQTMPAKVIAKCRALCSFLSASARATEAFRRKQVEVYGIVISMAKQLVQDIVTRWNSTYLMLLRIQTLRDALVP